MRLFGDLLSDVNRPQRRVGMIVECMGHEVDLDTITHSEYSEIANEVAMDGKSEAMCWAEFWFKQFCELRDDNS